MQDILCISITVDGVLYSLRFHFMLLQLLLIHTKNSKQKNTYRAWQSLRQKEQYTYSASIAREYVRYIRIKKKKKTEEN